MQQPHRDILAAIGDTPMVALRHVRPGWSSTPASAVLSGRPSGAHKIDGIGAGFVVPLWRPDLVGRIEPVSTDDAVAMSLRLALDTVLYRSRPRRSLTDTQR